MALSVQFLGTLAIGTLALVALVRAAEVVVERSTRLARYYDVPDELVAMTVIAMGTSLPEIGTGLIASVGILSGTLDPAVASATVLGGNMGSSTAQQFLLFGIFLVGHGRLQLSEAFVRSRYLPMILALGLTWALALDGLVSRTDGLVLVGAYGAYLYFSYTRRRRTAGIPRTESQDVGRDAAVGAGALALLLVASFVVLEVVGLEVVGLVVDRFALGGSMIGVVTIGVAAALPELSTVRAAIRREARTLALGTLVRSNVVNSLVGIGLGAAVSTYSVPSSVTLWDLPFKLVVAVGLLAFLYSRERRLGRGGDDADRTVHGVRRRPAVTVRRAVSLGSDSPGTSAGEERGRHEQRRVRGRRERLSERDERRSRLGRVWRSGRDRNGWGFRSGHRVDPAPVEPRVRAATVE